MIFSTKTLIANQIKQCYGLHISNPVGLQCRIFLFCYESSWDQNKIKWNEKFFFPLVKQTLKELKLVTLSQ